MKTYTDQTGVPCILLNHGKKVLPTPKIRYIESAGNYSCIKINGESGLLSSFTLRRFSDKLLNYKEFFIAKRGLLLNLSYLREIVLKAGVYYAIFKNGEKINLSRRKGKSLVEYILFHSLEIKIRNTI